MATITVPQAATKTQIDNAKAAAIKAGAGTTLQFPAGKLDYPARFVAPDGIKVAGKGIRNQGKSDGGGGTWLCQECHHAYDSDCMRLRWMKLVEKRFPGMKVDIVKCEIFLQRDPTNRPYWVFERKDSE